MARPGTGPPILAPRKAQPRRRSLGARFRHPKRERRGRFSAGSMKGSRQLSRRRGTTSPPVAESCTGPPIITPREGPKRRRSLGARPLHPKRERWDRFSAGCMQRDRQLSRRRGTTSPPLAELCTEPRIISLREGCERRRSLGARPRHPKRKRWGRFSAAAMQRGRQLSRRRGITSPPVADLCTGPRIVPPREGCEQRRSLGAQPRHRKRERWGSFSAARAWRGHRRVLVLVVFGQGGLTA